MSLPTTAGSRWLYSSGLTLIALACRPALCANAEAPTKGWWSSGAMLASSAMAWLTRCSSGRHSAGTTGSPILVTRLPISAKVSALPARSP